MVGGARDTRRRFSPPERPTNEDGHVSKPHRGLLAAGVAAAVVGSMGVVWTLGADAAESPAASAPAAAPAAEAEDEPSAPPLLPWGERPSPIKRAPAGTDSASVAAAGADAAPENASHTPVPAYGPKGRVGPSGTLKQERVASAQGAPAAAPAPAGTANSTKAADPTWYYYYAGARQTGASDGSWADLSIRRPWLSGKDAHSLTEISVQSADSRQIVEVGWTVDRKTNKDDDPHLFVYYWKDRTRTCYNTCGFTSKSNNVKPGDTLPVGETKRFGIQHFDGVWWVAYDSEWIGYFHDDLWEGRYTKAGLVQWFGEVTAASTAPCTDMGNGLLGTNKGALQVGSIALTEGPPVKVELIEDTNSAYYTSAKEQGEEGHKNFRYGGGGAC